MKQSLIVEALFGFSKFDNVSNYNMIEIRHSE